MNNELSPQENDIIFYTAPDGAVHIEVFFQSEMFWLSQMKMAGLFGVDERTKYMINTLTCHADEGGI